MHSHCLTLEPAITRFAAPPLPRRILKQVYSDPQVTRTDILEDEEVLTEFFGSNVEGRRIMEEITDEEWRDLL